MASSALPRWSRQTVCTRDLSGRRQDSPTELVPRKICRTRIVRRAKAGDPAEDYAVSACSPWVGRVPAGGWPVEQTAGHPDHTGPDVWTQKTVLTLAVVVEVGLTASVDVQVAVASEFPVSR